MDVVKRALDEAPVASLIVVVIGAIIGGIVTITNPDTLSFDDYLRDLGILAGGAGVLGVARNQAGRGLKKPPGS